LKIKLLFYSHDWLPTVGGIQTVTLSLATGLAEWDKAHPEVSLEVILVTQTPAKGMDDSRFPFRIVRCPSLRELVGHVRSADIVHMANPALLPLLFAYAFGTPAVVEHHGYQSTCPNGLLLYEPDGTICPGHYMAQQYRKCVKCNARELGWMGSVRKLFLTFPRRWLCKRVGANIAVSDHVAMRIALPHTRTIYHGIHDPGCVRLESVLGGEGDLRIGYVGRLVSEKGLRLLLDAANKLAKGGIAFHLTLIGDGPQRAELESITQRMTLQKHVTFAGELRGSDFETALQEIQVIVMPTQCEETAGLAAMEQMIRGGVVVVADVGGLSEIVGEAGLKFFAKDSSALSDRLRQIYENPSLIHSLGASARARASRLFNLEDMIRKHVQVYKEIIQRRICANAEPST
jgi:glycosyltransferase involved in cell wall biosynthesis